MVRSDRIRNLQCRYIFSYRTGYQFIVGIYHISRSTCLPGHIRILNRKFIFVQFLILCSLGIIVNITKCKTVLSGKAMDRGIVSSLEVESSVYRIT